MVLKQKEKLNMDSEVSETWLLRDFLFSKFYSDPPSNPYPAKTP